MNNAPVLFRLTGYLLSRHTCIFTFFKDEGTLVICYYFYFPIVIK
jgi:hypothetical protein